MPTANPMRSSSGSNVRSSRGPRRRLTLAIVGVTGLAFGLGACAPSVGGAAEDEAPIALLRQAEDEQRALRDEVASLEASLAEERERAETAEASAAEALEEIGAREAALAERAEELAALEVALAEREAAVLDREALVPLVDTAPHADPEPPTPDPAPEPTATTDPRFSSCREAIKAGYGPYVQGVDPEYDWYRDADKDGVVCER